MSSAPFLLLLLLLFAAFISISCVQPHFPIRSQSSHLHFTHYTVLGFLFISVIRRFLGRFLGFLPWAYAKKSESKKERKNRPNWWCANVNTPLSSVNISYPLTHFSNVQSYMEKIENQQQKQWVVQLKMVYLLCPYIVLVVDFRF